MGILKEFVMVDRRPMSTPIITNSRKLNALNSKLVDPTLYKHLIGSLMYMVNTRENVCFVLNTLSQCMVEPRRVHWVTMKRVLKYLWSVVEYRLIYIRSGVK